MVDEEESPPQCWGDGVSRKVPVSMLRKAARSVRRPFSSTEMLSSLPFTRGLEAEEKNLAYLVAASEDDDCPSSTCRGGDGRRV